MANQFVFNPFTANFDYVSTSDSLGGDGSESIEGVLNINVTAPITKSGLKVEPIIGMDLRTLTELPD